MGQRALLVHGTLLSAFGLYKLPSLGNCYPRLVPSLFNRSSAACFFPTPPQQEETPRLLWLVAIVILLTSFAATNHETAIASSATDPSADSGCGVRSPKILQEGHMVS